MDHEERDVRTDRADSGGGEKGARADLGAGIVQRDFSCCPDHSEKNGK